MNKKTITFTVDVIVDDDKYQKSMWVHREPLAQGALLSMMDRFFYSLCVVGSEKEWVKNYSLGVEDIDQEGKASE